MNDTTDRTQELTRILVHVVAPAGSAIWAFTQAVNATSAPVLIGLLLIVVGGLFYAFNQTIEIADERLNEESHDVPDVTEL